MKNNNLVSKNPVLRFKEGKKIVKAQNSWGPGFGIKNMGNIFGPKAGVGYENPNFDNNFSSSTFARYIGYNPPGFNGNMMYNLPNLDSNNISNNSSEDNLQIDSKLENLPPNPIGKRTTTKKVSSPIFYGTKAGGSVNRNALSNITDDLKSRLIGTGKFTELDFANTKKLLIALNNYFANDTGAGSIKEDNLWGNQTLKAFDLALSRASSPAVITTKGIEVQKPVSIVSPSTTPINLEVANLKLNVPQQTYDRTGVRELIRNKGINPYSFSGALRRALRMVLNNTADDNDKLLVKGMGLFKKGGLISKNPIERFKLNFR